MSEEASITDPPPDTVEEELDTLREALDTHLPFRKMDRNLLIATWNLRHFGGLTEKWSLEEGDSPKRNLRALLFIGEIVSRFDVIAIQEARANLKALRHLIKLLGDDWGMILTDENKGAKGNNERLAFVFDSRRVQPSGLAGEIVIPVEGDYPLDKQFARTPYAVSFSGNGETFILITLHVLWGDAPGDRVNELESIAEWTADWARDVHAWDHNLIVLGDFNIDRSGSDLHQAFTSTGLEVPAELHEVPRTIFQDKDEEMYYDQIAWFTESPDSNVPALSLKYTDGGSFDFPQYVMTELSNRSLSWRISDHYPLWSEFSSR